MARAGKSYLGFRTWLILIVAAELIVLYLVFSSPGKVSVDVNGDPAGLVDSFRALVQGKRFWKDQLTLVDKQLDKLISMPHSMVEDDKKINLLLEMLEQEREKTYQAHPEQAPSQAARRAEALRMQAHSIEKAERDDLSEKARIEGVRRLTVVRSIIEAKSK